MAASRISSLVMMQPLKSFKPGCLKWSFCWIFTSEGFKQFWLVWTIWYVYKDLIWRAQLCICRFQFASYCCGWFRIIFISGLFFGSDCFFDYIRLIVRGFTHDKSVLIKSLFSTPQARSQQQTEILIQLLKKLAPVNDIGGVLYLVDLMWIFYPRIW